jgi:S-DNA-T family DNA segregation ATPase FtsK/SpoIIIE
LAKVQNKGQGQQTGTVVSTPVGRGLREGALLISGALTLYLWASLFTFSLNDPAWNYSAPVSQYQNSGGVLGAWFSDILFTILGIMAWMIPPVIGWLGWLLFVDRARLLRFEPHLLGIRVVGFLMTLFGGTGISYLHLHRFDSVLPAKTGGVLGDWVGSLFAAAIGPFGSTLFLLALLLVGISIFTHISWFVVMERVGASVLDGVLRLRSLPGKISEVQSGKQAKEERDQEVEKERKRSRSRPKPKIEPKIGPIEISERALKEAQGSLFDELTTNYGSYSGENGPIQPPPLSLLNKAEQVEGGYSHETLEVLSRQVELKLKEFGVEVDVVAVQPGPVITRFELMPAPGIKASKITNLSSDLARSLTLQSVRVVEVIPGKATIGLEIPNEIRETVFLSEILASHSYDQGKGALTLALGKDISGQPVVADLARMPHLLVAGTTGSGKSVGINTMILSLLFKYSPEHVRLIMIDPKLVELSVYDGIPHLLAPVVTDMTEAASALRWSVAEMERRYKLMSALNVRSVSGLNKKVQEAIDAGAPLSDPLHPPLEGVEHEQLLEPLPYIVVFVDEFADLMMQVGKKVEELIVRIGQKARAAGIHMILATQRPSADVITGLIKSNVPSRIAFQVSSKMDSRVILDHNGAENLLGRGDMLYLPVGAGMPTRVHSAFVDDDEVMRVVEHLKSSGEPRYIDDVLNTSEASENSAGGEGGIEDAENDPLYDDAVRIVTESRKASVSGVQRRLRVGYNRASRLVEAMEYAGVVSPIGSNGQRDVLAPPPVEME